MTRQTLLNLIFNAVGALIGLTVVGYVVYSLVHTQTEAPCSTRYPAPLRFALDTNAGTLMSPIELQARVGLNEWGVIDNAKVVPAAEAPGGAALEVKLANVAEDGIETGKEHAANGVYFRWTPQSARAATAVCLSYEVRLADDFSFGKGGLLPGPFGGTSGALAGDLSAKSRFIARPQWRSTGAGWLEAAATGSGSLSINKQGFPLPKGRWLHIEQEMVLNTPGHADGLVRLWLDGELTAENTRMALRKSETEKFYGVLADIGYLRAPDKPGTLRITPFELSWK